MYFTPILHFISSAVEEQYHKFYIHALNDLVCFTCSHGLNFVVYLLVDMTLPESEEWKKNCRLLMETPVHQALSAMRRMGSIV